MNTAPLLEVTRIAEGLWRWTAPHPEWTPDKDRPGGWGRMVGSVYSEPPAGSSEAVALIDPQAPPEGSAEAEKFWAALDRDLERAGRPVVVLIGNGYHVRSARDVERRYAGRHGVTIHASADAVPRLGLVPAGRFGPQPGLVAGVDVLPIEGLDSGETAFFIRRHRTLVFADAVLGAGGGRLAVAPPSWAAEGEAARARYHERFRASIERLVALDPAMVLPSHGEPALARGRDALVAALAGPAWGE
jgi:hypothetical protein